jgi:hypothetical protein
MGEEGGDEIRREEADVSSASPSTQLADRNCITTIVTVHQLACDIQPLFYSAIKSTTWQIGFNICCQSGA